MVLIGNNKINLREFTLEDKTILAALCNNKKIWDNIRDMIPFPYTERDAISFIEYCMNENPKTTFAIEKNGNLVGTIGLILQTDIYKLTAEIGYWIGEPYWGQGIAIEAVKLLTNYGFEKLNLIRIHTGVFDYNISSQKVLEKSGYKLECIFKDSVIKNDKIIDEYRYSILKNKQ
jgi:[ribosomal protein S5]-alanine N-acetyltransferase